jgi:hypothetical protein
LYYKHISELEHVDLEAVWVEVCTCNKKILIGSYYRSDMSNAYWELIESSICDAIGKDAITIITGDFNANIMHSNNANIDNLTNSYNLTQLIENPTRITPTSATLIDLIFVSHMYTVKCSGVLDPSCSDHCPVFVAIAFPKPNKHSYTRIIYDYARADVDAESRY